jgi:hypothetical protein
MTFAVPFSNLMSWRYGSQCTFHPSFPRRNFLKLTREVSSVKVRLHLRDSAPDAPSVVM